MDNSILGPGSPFPPVLSFPVDSVEVLDQMQAILPVRTPAGDIRRSWSNYLELIVEPAGWLALWIPTIRTSSLHNWTAKRNDAVVVEVLDVVCSNLEAEIEILKACPTMPEDFPDTIDVPIDELYPIKDQENSHLNLLNTSICLDLIRFFYQNIWRPWDDDSDCPDWPGMHLASRIKLHFDLLDGAGNQSTAARLDCLAWQAEETQAQLCDLEETLGLDSDESLDGESLGKLLQLNLRKEQISREAALLEDPVMRAAAESVKVSNRKEARKEDGPALLLVWSGGSMQQFVKVTEEAQKIVGPDHPVICYPDLQHALDSSKKGDTVLVCGQHTHQMNGVGCLGEGGKILGIVNEEYKVVIEPSNAGDVFISVESKQDQVIIENVDIVLPQKQPFGVLVNSGNVSMKNVDIKGGENCLKLCGASSATLTNCSVSQSVKGLEIGTRSKLTMTNTQLSHCQVGILRHPEAELLLSGCKVAECEEYGMIFYGFDKEMKVLSNAGDLESEAELLGVALKNCNFVGNKFGHILIDQEFESKMADMSLQRSLCQLRRSSQTSTPRVVKLQYSICSQSSQSSESINSFTGLDLVNP